MINEMQILEGSKAVALTVRSCRVDVISAYPITPQTHIVEDLAQMVANGETDAEYIKVESEFSALSALVGASAAGARTYSSTTSQGLALMFEVLFNASGMRLPIVMTTVNRSLSAPLSIWNDQQDSISVRDAGWIQFYAENNQETSDLLPIAYRVAEDKDILLPAMCCMDGFVLTHTFEPVEIPEQSLVDEFLPSYQPKYVLDPKNPLTFGAYADPSIYMEFRYQQHDAMLKAYEKFEEVAKEFEKVFGRKYDLVEEYKIEDAEIVLISMGSIVGTMKDAVDELRKGGEKVGILKIISYRPFPAEKIYEAIKDAKVVVVLEKDVSVGMEGGLLSDIKSFMYNREDRPPIVGFSVGLGGRDVTIGDIKGLVSKVKRAEAEEFEFLNLRREVL